MAVMGNKRPTRERRFALGLDPESRIGAENMAEEVRAEGFLRSLRDWGLVFMLLVWLQSIMASAIARKSSVGGDRGEYIKARNHLMKKEMAAIWSGFKRQFPGEITEDEELMADMIILIRNQLAHCFVSSGTGLALFLPKASSRKLLERLTSAGWIEIPRSGASDIGALVMREGDRRWFERNTAMIEGFAENTVLRLTRDHGIEDGAIC